MNEVKRYECSICKSIYSDMNKAAKCEREHKTGLKLVDTQYESVFIRGLNFPQFVKLQSPDGKSMYYKVDM